MLGAVAFLAAQVRDPLSPEIQQAFRRPDLRDGPVDAYLNAYNADPVFRSWADTNLSAHFKDDHAIVTISLKAHGQTPGDATSDQMRVMADIAEEFGYDELRASHEQNIVLPHVHKSDLPAIHARLKEAGFGDDDIARIHAPVGLDIGAKSPAEIAMAVMAEITETLRKG